VRRFGLRLMAVRNTAVSSSTSGQRGRLALAGLRVRAASYASTGAR
jgi:hypothetical protein